MGNNYKKKNPVRIGRVNLGNPSELRRVSQPEAAAGSLDEERPADMAECLAIRQECGISQPGTTIRRVR